MLSLAFLTSLWAGPGRAHKSCGRINERQRYLTVFVLCFLLLPVISMTDDLHAMVAMAESERTGKLVAAVHGRPLHAVAHVYPACPITRSQGDRSAMDCTAISPTTLPAIASGSAATLQEGRAPPQNTLPNFPE